MGKTFTLATEYLIEPDRNEIILEIGSDRGEQSTEYFAGIAKKFKTKLLTVDIDDTVINQWINNKDTDQELISLTEFYHMSGSQFVKNILPKLGVKVKCLYLDNYDWNWNPSIKIDYIYDQIDWYKRRYNIDMNNQDCQVEHMMQMLGVMPYMADDGLVVCDDTYKREDNVFTGKCGPVVTYLLANNYKILEIIPGTGVVLQNQAFNIKL